MRNKHVSSKWKNRLAAACAMALVLGGSQLNAETAMAATPELTLVTLSNKKMILPFYLSGRLNS